MFFEANAPYSLSGYLFSPTQAQGDSASMSALDQRPRSAGNLLKRINGSPVDLLETAALESSAVQVGLTPANKRERSTRMRSPPGKQRRHHKHGEHAHHLHSYG